MRKILFLGFLMGGGVLASHPHMYLDSQVQLNFKDGRAVSATLTWVLDQFFGTSLVYDYDRNRDGKFSPTEISMLEREAFSNLKKYGYFVLLRSEKGRTSPPKVRDFTAFQNQGRLVYKFTIDLDPQVLGNSFYLAVFDTSFFCAVNYSSPAFSSVSLGGPLPPVQWSVVEDKNFPVYYNPKAPMSDKREYKQWQPGLLTAYPKEIWVKYGS